MPRASDDAFSNPAGSTQSDTAVREVLDGLRRPQKTLPTKYLYDERGSALFDRITELEAYYPTRTEIGIMHAYIDEITACVGRGVLLVEYGSGSSLKTRILLEHLEAPVGYVPIDISGAHLHASAERLREAFPGLRVAPVVADYTQPFALPRIGGAARVVVYFPGSTIGNFTPAEAERFLRRIGSVCGPGGGLLVGVDLRKDRAVLEAAYDDPEGVTAAFNLNLLRHLNRMAGADFDPAEFEHRALYNEAEGRVEMHLVSRTEQTVRVGGEAFTLRAGETIHTENSYKYTLPDFAALAGRAGFRVERVWTDVAAWFSIQFLATI